MKTSPEFCNFFVMIIYNFCKKFSFLADVVSKTFAIENALHYTHLEKVIYYVTLPKQSRSKTWFSK